MARRFLPIKGHILRLSVFAMMLFVCAAFNTPVASAGTADLTVETETALHKFKVEVMRTPGERAKGLMHRRHLPHDHGMIFDFGGAVIARMWMKNTYIPLDMLFIRPDGRIANIARNTVPHSTEVLSSDGKVRYVLEINGGLAAQLGISAGDQVTFSISP